MNNIFYNVGMPITPISTGTEARYFLLGNRCYGQSESFPEAKFGALNLDADVFGMKSLGQSPFRSENDFSLVSGACVNGALPTFMHDSLDPEKFLIGMDVGPLQVEPEIDYPSQDDVRSGTDYADGFFTGNMEIPSEDDVRDGVTFDSPNDEKEGTLIVPATSDVKLGVAVDDTVGTFDARRNITFKDSSHVTED
jgi:hypothetical protein